MLVNICFIVVLVYQRGPHRVNGDVRNMWIIAFSYSHPQCVFLPGADNTKEKLQWLPEISSAILPKFDDDAPSR